MDAYFANFPGFSRDLTKTNELEFARLRSLHGWNRSSESYRKWYQAFRDAMLEETGSEVDKFFLSGYPSFEYNRLASPKQQFLRLQRSPSWNLHGVEWRASARESFKKAYAEDFNRNIDKFFAPYHDFDYNPRGEAKAELWRLRNRKEWHFPKDEENWRPSDVKRNREYVIAREGFFAAFIADFHCFFGVGDDVQDWVFLCDVLRVRPAPPTVEECRAALAPYHVNIFNLLDHGQQKVPLILHPDLEALKEYTDEKHLRFPLELAQGTCMEFLLRRLDD